MYTLHRHRSNRAIGTVALAAQREGLNAVFGDTDVQAEPESKRLQESLDANMWPDTHSENPTQNAAHTLR